jgi:hypothetical protein
MKKKSSMSFNFKKKKDREEKISSHPNLVFLNDVHNKNDEWKFNNIGDDAFRRR